MRQKRDSTSVAENWCTDGVKDAGLRAAAQPGLLQELANSHWLTTDCFYVNQCRLVSSVSCYVCISQGKADKRVEPLLTMHTTSVDIRHRTKDDPTEQYFVIMPNRIRIPMPPAPLFPKEDPTPRYPLNLPRQHSSNLQRHYVVCDRFWPDSSRVYNWSVKTS